MDLPKPKSGGDFVPFLKFNAKAGRWYTKNDGKDEPEYEVENMTAVFDFTNAKAGWARFVSGQAPDIILGDEPDAESRATADHSAAYFINAFSDKNIGGVREITATSGALRGAIYPVFEEWKHSAEGQAGQLPVIKCEKVIPAGGINNNYIPILTIAGYVERPAELDDTPQREGGTAPAAAASAAPPTAATPVAPPAAATATDDVDF